MEFKKVKISLNCLGLKTMNMLFKNIGKKVNLTKNYSCRFHSSPHSPQINFFP